MGSKVFTYKTYTPYPEIDKVIERLIEHFREKGCRVSVNVFHPTVLLFVDRRLSKEEQEEFKKLVAEMYIKILKQKLYVYEYK